MTDQQRDTVHRFTWPLVAMAALIGLFFFGIFVAIPEDMPEARTALLGFLITASTSIVAVVVQRLATKVDRVERQNGEQMSTLLAAKTLPADQPVPLSALMCRECPGHEGNGQLCRYPLCRRGETE